jgi:hypothetical protein
MKNCGYEYEIPLFASCRKSINETHTDIDTQKSSYILLWLRDQKPILLFVSINGDIENFIRLILFAIKVQLGVRCDELAILGIRPFFIHV